MSGRHANLTNDSVDSTKPKVRSPYLHTMQLNSKLVQPEEIVNMPSEQILTHVVSIGTTVSTLSRHASRHQEAFENGNRILEHIGEGLQGVVFAYRGDDKAYKIALNDEASGLLKEEFGFYEDVYKAHKELASFLPGVVVPRPYNILDNSRPMAQTICKELERIHPRILKTFSSAPTIFVFDRIFPVPKIIRESLIDRDCPASERQRIKASELEKQCLMRTYLGCESTWKRIPGNTKAFSLRNFPLYLDYTTQTGQDTTTLARLMARSLATIHYKAWLDGDDIEYALGTTCTISTAGSEKLTDRKIYLYVLDFGRCERVEPRSGDNLAAKLGGSILMNDPYFPLPHPQKLAQLALWKVFKEEYVKFGCHLLEEQGILSEFWSELPREVVEYVEECIEDDMTKAAP